MPEPERILIVRPSALGDVCRSVPALASLRQAYPTAQIDWLVQDAFADAIRYHPALTNVIEFRRKELGATMRRGNIGPTRGFLSMLRAQRFSIVYDLQGLFRSGLFTWATRAPRRIGLANARELGWLGLTEKYHVPTNVHTVDRMLEVVRRSGVTVVPDMRLYSAPESRQRISEDSDLQGQRFALLAPTSRWPGKRWPLGRFATVAAELLSRGYSRVVLVGAPGERDQCTELIKLSVRDPRIVDRIGKTSVSDLMALTEAAALVIANDSAVLHMAVGFDRPLIALYGPTDLAKVGPYKREKDVLQHRSDNESINHKDGSGHALMDRISVDEVLARV